MREQWGPRMAVLSQSYLTFFDLEDPEVELDKIPLIEVISVSSKFLEQEALESEEEETTAFQRLGSGAAKAPRNKTSHSEPELTQEESRERTFLIRTMPGGANCGRNYTMCCSDGRRFREWFDVLEKTHAEILAWQEEREILQEVGSSAFAQFRYKTNAWYESDGPQVRHVHKHTRVIYIYIVYYTCWEHIRAREHMNAHSVAHECTHTRTLIHKYIHTYIHTCMHACMHACIHTQTHTRTRAHTHAHAYKLTNTHE